MTKAVDDSLGDYLKKERESRQVSVEAMAGAIHISKEMIKALEDNRFDTFSQPEFILGYLKLYSNHLGLDQDEVLKRANRAYNQYHLKHNHHALKPFLSYNSPLSQTGKTNPIDTLRRSDRIMKKVTLGIFMVLLISLFFFIPSEYKGPEAIRSDDLNKTSVAGIGATPKALVPAMSGANDSVPSVAPTTTAETSAPSVGEAPVKVIGNQDSKRYHLPGMKYYDQVQAYHRVIFDSEEAAIRAGYTKAPR